MLKIASESSTKRGRITDDKNSFVLSNFVIITCTLTSSIFNHTKHIDLPSSTKYRLFNKSNVKRKLLTKCVDSIKWSLEKKKIKRYPNVDNGSMIKVQD